MASLLEELAAALGTPTTRDDGIAKLKARMGGDTPWYMQKASPRGVDMNKYLGMSDARYIDTKVPRKPETEERPHVPIGEPQYQIRPHVPIGALGQTQDFADVPPEVWARLVEIGMMQAPPRATTFRREP